MMMGMYTNRANAAWAERWPENEEHDVSLAWAPGFVMPDQMLQVIERAGSVREFRRHLLSFRRTMMICWFTRQTWFASSGTVR